MTCADSGHRLLAQNDGNPPINIDSTGSSLNPERFATIFNLHSGPEPEGMAVCDVLWEKDGTTANNKCGASRFVERVVHGMDHENARGQMNRCPLRKQLSGTSVYASLHLRLIQ